MLRKALARAVVLVTAVTASVFALSAPALAFTKHPECIYDGTLLIGQKIWFFADDGGPKSEVSWYFRTSGSRYAVGMDDPAPYDNAVTVIRVDDGTTVRQYYQDVDDENGLFPINHAVRKYRVVWNGNPTIWLSPNSCTLGNL